MYDWVIPTLITLGLNVFIWGLAFFHIRAKEKEREETERHLFIHQRQFEKEFEIYEDLWGKVLVLKKNISKNSITGTDEESLQKLDNYIDEIHPFIFQDVFEKAKKVADEKFHKDNYQHANEDRDPLAPRPYVREVAFHWKTFFTAVEELAEEMQKRILLLKD